MDLHGGNGSFLVAGAQHLDIYRTSLYNIVLKDCGRVVKYRAAKVMLIGTSSAVLVVLMLVAGSLLYRRLYSTSLRRNRTTSETPPEREPSSSGEVGQIRNTTELDILNSDCPDRILADNDNDPRSYHWSTLGRQSDVMTEQQQEY